MSKTPLDVKIKLVHPDAKVPEYKTEGAAGFDLYMVDEEVELKPAEIIKIPLKGNELREAQNTAVEIMASYFFNDDEKHLVYNAFGEENVKNALLSKIPKDAFFKYALVTYPVVVETGVAFEIPEGYEMEIRGRSGLGFKHNIEVHNGTIDSDYRGTVGIKLYNLGNTPIILRKGDRIAQGVIKPVERAKFHVVDELSKTERGEKGRGSTGLRDEEV